MPMQKELEHLRLDFEKAVQTLTTLDELEALRIEFLGRKGKLAHIMKALGTLEANEKKEAGMFANRVKEAIEAGFAKAEQLLFESYKTQQLEEEWIDISLPPISPVKGHLHLSTQAIQEIVAIFSRLGFSRVRHPEVDWDYYAFESLNMPKEHPARDEWETFFIADGDKVMEGKKGKVVLTPHTSNGQVREMEKGHVPIRMMNINKTYRRQATTRHLPMFHQFEGLVIDKNITITDLKGVFDYFVKNFFGDDRSIRLRPYHFRFTEPSFELDISCGFCHGTALVDGVKCRMCKGGWLELGGAGMVHPNVLKAGGLDPEVYSGFAFGWGLERTMLMKSGMNIDDIRVLYRNDLRFLEQF